MIFVTSSTSCSAGKAGSKLANAENASANVMSSVVESWYVSFTFVFLFPVFMCACLYKLNPPGIPTQEGGMLRALGWFLQDGRRCTQCRERHRRVAEGEQWDWSSGRKGTSRAAEKGKYTDESAEIYWHSKAAAKANIQMRAQKYIGITTCSGIECSTKE